MTNISFALYFKFYESKLNSLKNWLHVFESIKDKKNVTVYIWVESLHTIENLLLNNNLLKKYANEYGFVIITQSNKNLFYDSKKIDKNIKDFAIDVGLTDQVGDITLDTGSGHIYAHLRSFIIPKEDYIYHIDGDDLFIGDWLGYDQLLRGVQYLDSTDKMLLAKPFCICVGLGFSFSFVLQRKNTFDKMFIMNPQDLPNGFKKRNFYKKNLDMNKMMNTDNYFGMMLMDYYGYEKSDLFFSFIEDPFWYSSSIIRGIPIRGKLVADSKQMEYIKNYDINIITSNTDMTPYCFTYKEYSNNKIKINPPVKNGYYTIKNVQSGLYINPESKNSLSQDPHTIKITTIDITNSYLCLSETTYSINNRLGRYMYTVPYNNNVYTNGDSDLWSTFYLEKQSDNTFKLRTYQFQSILYNPLITNKYGELSMYVYVNDSFELKSNGSRKDMSSLWQIDPVIT